MRTLRLLSITLLVSLVPAFGAGNPGETPPKTPASVNPVVAYRRLPLSFEANQGQTDPKVKFLTRGPAYNLFLTADEAVVVLGRPAPMPPARSNTAPARAVVRLKLMGANPNVKLAGEDELLAKSNYFIGNDPNAWHTDVPNYSQVRYRSLYRGVDAVFYGRQGNLEYDFVVAPGSDPRQVRFRIQGAEQVSVDKSGDLLLQTKEGSITLRSPQAYQGIGGHRRRVAVRYAARANDEFGFEVPSYRRDRTLTIDPALLLSTYLGGSGGDVAYGVAVDSAGNVYVAGETNSTDFPTDNPYQSASGGGGDAFISELNTTGTQLKYSTYFGGSGSDSAAALAVNASGAAFITGTTYSTNFPVFPTTTASNPSAPTAFQPTYGGSGDAFVEVFTSAGKLTYSSYLGGSGADFGQGITFDSSGNAYVTGSTESPDFNIPTGTTPFQATLAGSSDAFVAEVNVSGTELVGSTYLGGTQADTGQSIQVDGSGNIYVTGYTFSTNFPTMNPIQSANAGNADVFVTELNNTLTAPLTFSTYLGGTGRDRGFGIALDSSANMYITGDTQSTKFPTSAPPVFQDTYGGNGDAFVTQIKAGATPALGYSTYLGGTGTDQANAVAVDSSGNVGVVGFTNSSDFPLTDAMQQILGLNGGSGCGTSLCTDAFVTKLNSSGSAALYSTFLGGSGDDFAQAVAVDSAGDLYVAGSTLSSNFPALGPGSTAGAYQGNLGGVAGNAFVAEVEAADAPAIAYSPQKLNFGNEAVSVTSTTQTLTIVDEGSAALVISSITAPSSDFTESDNCVGTVAARGGTCTINIAFTPIATGSVTDEFSIDDNSPSSPHIITVTGTGVTNATSVTVTPTTLTFANTAVGSTTPAQTAIITNTGTSTLDITNISVTGDFTETNTCSGAPLFNALGPGQSCKVSVIFAPIASGVRSGTLSISDNATGSPQGIALSGTGLAQFSLSATNPTISAIIGTSSVTYTITAASATSFTGSIALACPSNLTCSFSPTAIAANAKTGSTLTVSNLTISTPNPLNIVITGTSGSQTATVNLTLLLSTFTLSVSPSVQSVVAGAPALYTVLVNPVFDFNQEVLLTCNISNAPGTGCTFSPSALTLNGTAPSKVQLKVTTTVSNSSGWRLWPGGKSPPWFLPVLGGIWLVLTSILVLKAKRWAVSGAAHSTLRIASRAVVLAALCVLLVLLGSCRGLTSATSPTPGGTYTFTITGTLQSNSDVTVSTTATLSVGPTP